MTWSIFAKSSRQDRMAWHDSRSGKKIFHPSIFLLAHMHTYKIHISAKPHAHPIKIRFFRMFFVRHAYVSNTQRLILGAPIWVKHHDYSLTNNSAKINSNGTVQINFRHLLHNSHANFTQSHIYAHKCDANSDVLLTSPIHGPTSASLKNTRISSQNRSNFIKNDAILDLTTGPHAHTHKQPGKTSPTCHMWKFIDPLLTINKSTLVQKCVMKTCDEVQCLIGIGFYVEFAILHANVSTFDGLLIATHD